MGKHINVINAIKDTSLFLSYLPDKIDTSITFRLSYGRLKIWQYSQDLFWVGLILPYKHNPTINNLIHITREEYINIALNKE